MVTSSDRPVLLIANGEPGSAAYDRAIRIASLLGPGAHILGRSTGRLCDVARMVRLASRLNPGVVYCVDLAAVPVLVGLTRTGRSKLIVDTGDYPSAFLRQVGARPAQIAAALVMEELVYRHADAVVVRGRHHEAVMRGHGVERIEVIPDGVDLSVVRPIVDSALREQLGLSNCLTVGIAGHFTWYESLGGGIGWELVYALSKLRDVPVHGVLIGDGPGVSRLRLLAAELGLSDRLHILGRIPYEDYARYVGLVDVCLLTQTNDKSSWIRTTGKLPGYLATERYVLASRVGTAVDVLPQEMLIPYEGRWDPGYPDKVAMRIRELVQNPAALGRRHGLRALARHYDYDAIAEQASGLVRELAGTQTR